MNKQRIIIYISSTFLAITVFISSCGTDKSGINTADKPAESTVSAAVTQSQADTSVKPAETTEAAADSPVPSEDQQNIDMSGVEFSLKIDAITLALRESGNMNTKLEKLPLNLVQIIRKYSGKAMIPSRVPI